MDKVVTYSLQEDFIQGLVRFIEDNFLKQGRDISRLAFVFGGRRPSLFLKREISKRLKKGFYPPAFFSIDKFVEYVLSKKEPFSKVTDLDASYAIYNLAKEIAPGILKGRERFSEFLPWAREISSFIEQLDLEDIKNEDARNIEKSASIGYEIPDGINKALENIISLRGAFHSKLEGEKTYSRGMMYLIASRSIQGVNLDEFDNIIFCGHYYLQKTEERIIRTLYDSGKGLLFFHGDEKDWPVLKRVAQDFKCKIQPASQDKPNYKLNIESGFDSHSEACLVRETLKKIKNLDKTVIVLPKPGNLIPLLSEIASFVDNFNVSMGYPLKRGSVFNLFESVFRAQSTRKDTKYYARDYLRALTHPFIKNLGILRDSSVTRVLTHKIEEILLGIEKTPVGGSLFLDLDEITGLPELYALSRGTLKAMDIEVREEELPGVIKELHEILFSSWEGISNFSDFSQALDKFLDVLVRKSFLGGYPLDLKIVERMFGIKEELKNAAFSKELFPKDDIFKIFENKLSNELVSFSGSPLKGLQILGLLETRSLSFENVIVMDVNESELPRLTVYEPLIPREVMLSLGLNSLEREEEIQRYHFMRLIASAKNVHLIYEESTTKKRHRERSRFIEELIWKKEKETGMLNAADLVRGRFNVDFLPKRSEAKKTPDMIKVLKRFKYSASSINTYLTCPLRFYYQRVLGIKEKEDLLEDIEASHVGTFIHELLEDTFREFLGKKPLIGKKFRDYFCKALGEKFESDLKKRMKSDSFTLQELMRFRLEKFLDAESKRNVKEVLFLEEKFEGEIRVDGNSIRFTSRVDRIDRLEDGSLLVLDYKTGGEDPMPRAVDKIDSIELTRESIKASVRSFQLPLYYYLVKQRHKRDSINAALYNLRSSDIKRFLKDDDVLQGDEIVDSFMRALRFIIREILNPDVCFQADDENTRYCKHCPYFYMCR